MHVFALCAFSLCRGFSRKLNDLVKLHQDQHEEETAGARRKKAASKEKFEPKNWKALTAHQLSKMTPMERSRYLVVNSRLLALTTLFVHYSMSQHQRTLQTNRWKH